MGAITRELHTAPFLAWYDAYQKDRDAVPMGAMGRVYDEWRQDAYNGGTDRSGWNAHDHEEYARALFDDAYEIAAHCEKLEKAAYPLAVITTHPDGSTTVRKHDELVDLQTRALLAVEWRPKYCPMCGASDRRARITDGSEEDDTWPSTHHELCLIDAALTAVGLDTAEKRDAARKAPWRSLAGGTPRA